MNRTVPLVERKLVARTMVLVPVHVVNGLIQAAAKRDVQLLKTAADGEQRRLPLDRGADERKGQGVARLIQRVSGMSGASVP